MKSKTNSVLCKIIFSALSTAWKSACPCFKAFPLRIQYFITLFPLLLMSRMNKVDDILHLLIAEKVRRINFVFNPVCIIWINIVQKSITKILGFYFSIIQLFCWFRRVNLFIQPSLYRGNICWRYRLPFFIDGNWMLFEYLLLIVFIFRSTLALVYLW